MRIIDDQHGRVGRWVIERTGGTYTKEDTKAIGLEQDGKLVAGTIFNSSFGNSVCIHLACDKSLTREFIWFCFYYAFDQLSVKKLIGMVDCTNEKALRLNKRLGFIRECVIKDGSRNGDMVIMTMTRDQCRWLSAVKRQGAINGQG